MKEPFRAAVRGLARIGPGGFTGRMIENYDLEREGCVPGILISLRFQWESSRRKPSLFPGWILLQ